MSEVPLYSIIKYMPHQTAPEYLARKKLEL